MLAEKPAGAVDGTDDAAVRTRLAASHVALIGCGGLGSNAAAMLLRAGVRELTLIDFDVVEPSNLNRQLFFQDQLGLPKTEALAQTLMRIDPAATLHLHQVRVTAENLVSLIEGADVVIEAVDRADTKALIVNTLLAEKNGLPLIAASGLAGVDSANSIATDRLTDDLYMVGDLESDVTDGHCLLASRVMVAAAHEAHAAIRVLLGYPES